MSLNIDNKLKMDTLAENRPSKIFLPVWLNRGGVWQAFTIGKKSYTTILKDNI
jgi:hypothetical protein